MTSGHLPGTARAHIKILAVAWRRRAGKRKHRSDLRVGFLKPRSLAYIGWCRNLLFLHVNRTPRSSISARAHGLWVGVGLLHHTSESRRTIRCSAGESIFGGAERTSARVRSVLYVSVKGLQFAHWLGGASRTQKVQATYLFGSAVRVVNNVGHPVSFRARRCSGSKGWRSLPVDRTSRADRAFS